MKKTANKRARKAQVTKTKNSGRKLAVTKGAARLSARTAVVGGRKTEVAALMRRPDGVTTAQIKEATGMLEHSARALISGIAKSLPKTETVAKTKNGSNATVYAIKPAK